MTPVGWWLRIDGYNKSTGAFGDIDSGIFLVSSCWEKRVKILSSWLSSNCQIHKRLVLVQAELMQGYTLRRLLDSVTSETVSNYSSESGLFNKSRYISGKVILWASQRCCFEPFIRFALRQVDSHLL